MMELEEPYRTLVFLVAVTGLRISEALGLKWSDLDYERQMIQLRRVWVGNELVPRLKTDGSAAPVPLGDLLADALQSWHRNSLYAKPDDWVFPSIKMKGKTPLSDESKLAAKRDIALAITNSQPQADLQVSCVRHWRLQQLRVLSLGCDENRNVGVGVFPESKEILVGRAGLSGVGLQRVGAPELQMRQWRR
jgi:integrase